MRLSFIITTLLLAPTIVTAEETLEGDYLGTCSPHEEVGVIFERVRDGRREEVGFQYRCLSYRYTCSRWIGDSGGVLGFIYLARPI